MINFIVVEDNKIHQKNIEKIILSYMMKNDYEFEIKLFDKETKELNNLIKKNDENSIYILDFELPNTNAIDISRLIRENNWTSPIIIFTTHGGMAFETFKQRLQILDFISKQYNPEENLIELFDICMKQFNVNRSFKFRYKCVDYNIPFDKILYFERDSNTRKVIIKTDTGSYEIYITMKELKDKLDKNFILTHKACIVNMKRVSSISWKDLTITFDNKEKTYLLSKTHKKEVKEYYE